MTRKFRLPRIPQDHPTPEQSLYPDGSGRLGPASDDYSRIPVGYARTCYFIFCPNCDEPNKCPFSGLEIWTIPDVTIRKFNTCEHCGTRFRIRIIAR
jgi:hypothetical protein